jgi:outer membrane protein assembly factor BamB
LQIDLRIRGDEQRSGGVFVSEHLQERTTMHPRHRTTAGPKRLRNRALAVSLLAAATAGLAHRAAADDWPQWRGPQRTGISAEKGLLQEWPAAGPRQVWAVSDLGSGYGTPAIAGGKLFLQSNKGPEDELVQALSAADGKPIWSVKIGKVGNPDQQPAYPGTRSTPTVDGAVVYALGSDGDLAALETGTGKVRWKKSLRADFGGKPGVWAYSESPLIDGDTLVCTPGGDEATILALNKRTGAVIWKSAIPGEQAAYSSPIVLTTGGIKQYVQFIQKGVVGVDAKTGKLLWRYDQTAKNSPANIPTPVAFNDMVYTSTNRGGGGLVRLKVEQGAIQVEPVYAAMRLPTAIGGSVRLGDYLYGTSGAGLMCVQFATGEVKWQERGIGAASICFADGRLYLHGENGQVALVEPSPEGYREKGRFTPAELPERGKSQAWAYPVVANGRLYIRDLNKLWCYDVKTAK